MRRILLAAAAAAIMAFASTCADAIEFGARGEYWFPKLSGTVQTTTNGIPETPIDVINTLGIQDQNFPFGEGFLRVGNFTFRVGYTQVNYDGSNRLSQSIEFNGITYTALETVVSKFDLKMLDGDVQYDFLRPDVGIAGFNLGLILKVKYVDGKMEIRGGTPEVATAQDFKVPLPMVGAAVGVGFLKNMIRIDARGAGIAYSGNHLYDVDACASFSPLPFVSLQGGYRYIDLKGDESDLAGSIKLKGPYAGAQLSF